MVTSLPSSVTILTMLTLPLSSTWAAAPQQKKTQSLRGLAGHRYVLDAANCKENSIKQCSATSGGNDLWCRTDCDIIILSLSGFYMLQ